MKAVCIISSFVDDLGGLRFLMRCSVLHVLVCRFISLRLSGFQFVQPTSKHLGTKIYRNATDRHVSENAYT